VAINLWLEPVIDAYLRAAASRQDWRAACAVAAEQAVAGGSLRVVSREGLKAKGLKLSRQHLHRKIRAGAFPKPFHLPNA
jgi:hypothetical protein